MQAVMNPPPDQGPSRSPQRKIIHVDMDMFFAAIEVRERPSLAMRPVAVGGSPDRRGVVATANYVARKFGVRSAMAMSQAVRLCPNLVIVPPRFEAYQAESKRIHAIFRRYADAIEPLSLDEAYLDVTGSEHFHGSATLIATAIRREIREATKLTASAGVGPNKFLAKIASDWRKPDGLTVILPDDVPGFVAALTVNKIPGVGPKTAAKLADLGVTTCGDLQALTEAQLRDRFGKWGPRLFALARGIDTRAVVTERIRMSLSVERTYPVDLPDFRACQHALKALFSDLSRRFEQADVAERTRGWSLKIRFDDFQTTTLDRSLPVHVAGETFSLEAAPFEDLLAEAWSRGKRPVRLIGIGVRLKSPTRDRHPGAQLELWPTG